MTKLVTAIVIIGLLACNQQTSKGETKVLDFGAFTIDVPMSWEQVEKTGVDSYVGAIVLEYGDTLNFDLGWYSNKLYEFDPTILDSSIISSLDTSMIDTSNVIFVRNRLKVDPDSYRRNNVRWDTIDGRKAKIVFPRRSGVGTTGIYIDSLWISGSDVDRFNLYGENLEPTNEKKVLQALKTLKFRKNK